MSLGDEMMCFVRFISFPFRTLAAELFIFYTLDTEIVLCSF